MSAPYLTSLEGKVAVVTGAASGIGRELAWACAREGARVALADVDERGLAETARLLDPGSESMQVRCDVSKASDLETLAQRTYERFGAAHAVFNNAGVAVAGPVWSAPLDEWKWVLDVNLMGVVHGIRAFVPRMLEAKTPGHVVNTASVAGLLSVPGSGVYCASKHAVVSLSECLHHDLKMARAAIGVSVLCPAWVATGIADSERNRPGDLAERNPLAASYEEAVRKAVASGKLSAAEVARVTIDAVKANRFYVLPHQRIKASIESRMRDILDEREPVDVSRPRPA
ncbi:MAG TPA: SDR family NAD(P)-dependent oxidoreductase [Usitatibacter sp.]|nr:SDR family NAD(P)-dependent oxidoreductase [Usitatibacter sp.]